MHARTLPSRHGALWLVAGFQLFRRAPMALTGLTFAYLMLVIVLNLIPGIGPFLLPALLPTLTALLANGCRAIESGRQVTPAVLFDHVSEQRIGLIRLGGIHLIGSLVLVMISMATGTKLELADGMTQEEAAVLLQDIALLLLFASPLLMAFWFAPLLTLWDNVSAGKSVFFSFVASWRNWRAFLAYGLAILLFGALVPGFLLVLAHLVSPGLAGVLSGVFRMLMLFVLAPVLVASIYLSYRDVFHTPAVDVIVTDE